MTATRSICTIITFCISIFSHKIIGMNINSFSDNRLLSTYKDFAQKELPVSKKRQFQSTITTLRTDEKIDQEDFPLTKKDLKSIKKIYRFTPEYSCKDVVDLKICYFTPQYLCKDMVDLILLNAPLDTVTALGHVCKYFHTYYAYNFLKYIINQRAITHALTLDEISKIRLQSCKEYIKKHDKIITKIKNNNLEIFETEPKNQNFDLYYTDQSGNSFLHAAVIAQNDNIIFNQKINDSLTEAIKSMANDSRLTNIQNKDGETPIMLTNNMETLKLLADKTNLTILNKNGENAPYRLLKALGYDNNKRDCAEFFFSTKKFDPDQTLVVKREKVTLGSLLYKIFPKKNKKDRIFLKKLLGDKYDKTEYEKLTNTIIRRLDFTGDEDGLDNLQEGDLPAPLLSDEEMSDDSDFFESSDEPESSDIEWFDQTIYTH